MLVAYTAKVNKIAMNEKVGNIVNLINDQDRRKCNSIICYLQHQEGICVDTKTTEKKDKLSISIPVNFASLVI